MDMFLPSPSDLLVNLNEARGLVHQLLEELPNMFKDTNETFSAVGAALQAAYKLASPTGGRVTVFQHTLPTIGKKKFKFLREIEDELFALEINQSISRTFSKFHNFFRQI